MVDRRRQRERVRGVALPFTQSNTNNADGNNDGISLLNNGTSRIYFGSDGAGDFVIRAIAGQSVADADAFANTFVGAVSGQTFQLVVNINQSTGYTMWVNPTGFDYGIGVPRAGSSAAEIKPADPQPPRGPRPRGHVTP